MNALAVLAVLLVVVAWLAAGAMAVRSVSRIWLRHWVDQRLRGAAVAELYLERPQRLLLAAATGVALAAFVAGEVIVAAYPSPPLRTAEGLVGAAIVVLVLGQLLPRAVARRWGARLVPILLPVLRGVDVLVRPLLFLATVVAQRVHRGARGPAEPPSRDGLEDLLREGELEGVGERDEIAIITGVVHFGEKRLTDVLTPRDEVFAVEESTPREEMSQRIARAGYSRVPVYRGTLDHVVGMVHVFDVLKAGSEGAPPLRPVGLAAGDRPCNEQLFEMLRGRRHLSVVRDADGRTVGIVTLEDLLEELVGDIRDEHDEPLPPRPADAA